MSNALSGKTHRENVMHGDNDECLRIDFAATVNSFSWTLQALFTSAGWSGQRYKVAFRKGLRFPP